MNRPYGFAGVLVVDAGAGRDAAAAAAVVLLDEDVRLAGDELGGRALVRGAELDADDDEAADEDAELDCELDSDRVGDELSECVGAFELLACVLDGRVVARVVGGVVVAPPPRRRTRTSSAARCRAPAGR